VARASNRPSYDKYFVQVQLLSSDSNYLEKSGFVERKIARDEALLNGFQRLWDDV
jgi:hypothetical protein